MQYLISINNMKTKDRAGVERGGGGGGGGGEEEGVCHYLLFTTHPSFVMF